jgi:hypothetical protein
MSCACRPSAVQFLSGRETSVDMRRSGTTDWLREAATTELLSDWPQCRPLRVLCSPVLDARLSHAQSHDGRGALVGAVIARDEADRRAGGLVGASARSTRNAGGSTPASGPSPSPPAIKPPHRTRSQHHHLSSSLTPTLTANTSQLTLRHEAPRLGRLCGIVRHRDVPGLLPLGLRPR